MTEIRFGIYLFLLSGFLFGVSERITVAFQSPDVGSLTLALISSGCCVLFLLLKP